MSESSENERGYELLLLRLERWTDELATRGPKAVPEVYREMNRVLENDAARPEPCIDFDHQKNYT
jgi:hypothetical protein